MIKSESTYQEHHSLASPEKAFVSTELAIGEWFEEVIAGGFRPEVDAEGRTHTLPNLAEAIYHKGRVVDEPADKGFAGVKSDEEVFAYSPSWAPNVLSTALVRLDGQDAELLGVTLKDDQGNLTMIKDTSIEQTPNRLWVVTNKYTQALRASDYPTETLQRAVTNAVSGFFEQHVAGEA